MNLELTIEFKVRMFYYIYIRITKHNTMEKSLFFNKFMVLSLFIFLMTFKIYSQKTLPVYDGFNYSAGTLVYDAANWWVLNGAPVNDVSINTGSLAYDGLMESNANKLSISGAGDDFVVWFGDRPVDSRLYYSFLFQVTDMAGISTGTPTHFAGFTNSHSSIGSFGCSIFLQKDASDPSKFNIGHSARSSYPPVWNSAGGIPVQYSLNTPILVVGCYEIIGAFVTGIPNDKSSVWINPLSSTFETEVPPTADISGDLTGTGLNDLNPVNSFYIRQDAASNNPSIEMDEIRIGLNWAQVTPKSIPTGVNDDFKDEGNISIHPNPAERIMNVEVRNSNISDLELYSLTGTRLMSKEISQGITDIDVSSLPQGIYIISLKGTGVMYSRKLVKK